VGFRRGLKPQLDLRSNRKLQRQCKYGLSLREVWAGGDKHPTVNELLHLWWGYRGEYRVGFHSRDEERGLLNWGGDDRVQDNARTMGVVRRLRGRVGLWGCAGGHAGQG
jgi:hypothetical protein